MAVIRALTSVILVVVVSCGYTRTASLSEDPATNPHRAIEATNRGAPVNTTGARQRSDETGPVARAPSAHYVPDLHKSFRPCLLGAESCLALAERPFEVCLLSLDRCLSEPRIERAERGQHSIPVTVPNR